MILVQKFHALDNEQRYCIVLFVLCLLALLFAYAVFQKALGLVPCPLCIIDRVAITIIAIGCVFRFLGMRQIRPSGQKQNTTQKRNKRLSMVGMFFGIGVSVIGFVIGFSSSIRHVWIELFPASSSCLFPAAQGTLLDYVANAFAGTADCASATWRIAGLTLAQMTLIFFVLLVFVFVRGFFARQR